MNIKERLLGKKLHEHTTEELKRLSKKYNMTFCLYAICALLVISVFMITGGTSLNDMRGMEGILLLLAFNVIITSLCFGFMIFLWMVNESSYYKMLQLHTDLILYLKEKEEKEKRYQ